MTGRPDRHEPLTGEQWAALAVLAAVIVMSVLLAHAMLS